MMSMSAYASNWIDLRKIVPLPLTPERLIALSNARLNKRHVRLSLCPFGQFKWFR